MKVCSLGAYASAPTMTSGVKNMRRKLITTYTVLVVLLALAVGTQALRVVSTLHTQEYLIKEALRAAPEGTLQSNAADGAKRFIDTGELVFELSYLWNPAGVKNRRMLNIRVYPRVSTHGGDGWVGIYQGNWYVKIF